MSTAWLDSAISLLQLFWMLCVIVLAILLYWHLKRINKPVLAFIYWCVMMLTALVPAFQIFQSGVSLSKLPWMYVLWPIGLPALIALIWFFNPLKKREILLDEDDDDDTPFEIPDEV